VLLLFCSAHICHAPTCDAFAYIQDGDDGDEWQGKIHVMKQAVDAGVAAIREDVDRRLCEVTKESVVRVLVCCQLSYFLLFVC
jgi:hypothetical protein